jgi:hypothetical protein
LPPGALFRIGSIRFRYGDGIDYAQLSPDGRSIVTSTGFGIVFFDLSTGVPFRHIADAVEPNQGLGRPIGSSVNRRSISCVKNASSTYWK